MYVCGYEWCMCARASRNVCMYVHACAHASVNSRGSQGPEAHICMRQNSLRVTSSPLELNIPTSVWEERHLPLQNSWLMNVRICTEQHQPWLLCGSPGCRESPGPPSRRSGEDMGCLAGVPPLRQTQYLKPLRFPQPPKKKKKKKKKDLRARNTAQ